MKHSTRFMSALLAAVMLISISAIAIAEDETTVYIPSRIAKLNLPDRPGYITLKTQTESTEMRNSRGSIRYKTDARGNIIYDYNGNPIPLIGTVEDADIELQFSEKPDWAGVIWAEGYENLEVDDTGYAVTSMEGHMRQPGTWVWNNPDTTCDPLTGEIVWRDNGTVAPSWCHITGGDFAYMAGKGNVSAQYGRSGKVNYVEYRVEEDFFRTGMEGAYSVIRYEPVTIKSICGPEDDPDKYTRKDTVWYVSSVIATYPDGNYIVEVEADYRNDAKNTLASYKITYATSDKETYKITYAPSTTTVLEDHETGTFMTWPSKMAPSTDLEEYFRQQVEEQWQQYGTVTDPQDYPDYDDSYTALAGMYLHHYTQDEVLCGEYKSGKTHLMSGSGKNLKYWYKFNGTGTLNGVKVNNNGKKSTNKNLKPCTYFKSPRVQ